MTRDFLRAPSALKGYKTIAVNLLALAAVWLGVPEDTLRAWAGEIVTGLAAVNVLLRFVTNGPALGGVWPAVATELRDLLARRGGFGFVLAAILLPAVLSACEFPRGAGMTNFSVKTLHFDETGRVTQECSAHFTDGKERDGVSAGASICGGAVHYTASGERAFRAFEIAAEAQKVSVEVLGRVVPDVVGAALSAYTGAGALSAVSDAVAAKAALDAARLKAETLKAAGAAAKSPVPIPSGPPQ